MKPVGYALRTFLRPDLLQMVRNAYPTTSRSSWPVNLFELVGTGYNQSPILQRYVFGNVTPVCP
jgi:hypothetical protein